MPPSRVSVRRTALGVSLATLLTLSLSCNERFEFDIPDADAGTGGGAAGAAPVASAEGTGGTGPDVSGCADDGDCGSAGLSCDAGSGRCVECNLDDDCQRAGQPRCDGQLQRCVACLVDADCALGFECDAVERRCAQTCDSLEDCDSEAHICLDGRCLACDRDVECRDAGGGVCSRSGLACVSCREDAQCPPDRFCDVLSGGCVECVSSLDCADGMFCDPVSLACG